MSADKPLPYREPRQSVASANLRSSAAAMLIASLLLVLFQFLFQRSALMEDMQVQASLLADSSRAPLMFGDARAARDTLAVLAASPNVEHAAIYDARHDMLAGWPIEGSSPTDWPPRFEQSLEFGLHVLDVVQPVQVEGQAIGHVVLRVHLEQFYHRLLIFVGCTLAVAMASLFAAHVLLARMRRKVRSAEANLEYLAHTDPVTHLFNRHAFNAALAAALQRADEDGGQATLMLLDLDNFKSVNDTLGHQSGDLLLQQVARKLAACLRNDDLLFRIGGDEFALILASQGAAAAADSIAAKLLAVLGQPVRVDQHELYVTASIGISVYPRDAADVHSLARNADNAMYEAKAAGKNGYTIFHAGMAAAAQRRLVLESGLRRALENGELSVHYQPQASLATGQITGMEALLRWQHPELGNISPNEFIPVAEESGLIEPIGMWALRTACAQAADWHRAGLGRLTVGVNLSARQTRDSRLAQAIQGILEETGLEPGQLELEITESLVMENMEGSVRLLAALRQSGIRLAMDDFGTGYSSFAYLKQFPLDQLKVDRTFVNDIDETGGNGAIVAAIISMAHELGIAVVAEGVETPEQAGFLRRAGCDTIQGYYLARPMAAERATDFLHHRRSGAASGAGLPAANLLGPALP